MYADLFETISSFGDLMFWILFLVAISKYNVLSKLPTWLAWLLIAAMGVSGIAGLLSHLF